VTDRTLNDTLLNTLLIALYVAVKVTHQRTATCSTFLCTQRKL